MRSKYLHSLKVSPLKVLNNCKGEKQLLTLKWGNLADPPWPTWWKFPPGEWGIQSCAPPGRMCGKSWHHVYGMPALSMSNGGLTWGSSRQTQTEGLSFQKWQGQGRWIPKELSVESTPQRHSDCTVGAWTASWSSLNKVYRLVNNTVLVLIYW